MKPGISRPGATSAVLCLSLLAFSATLADAQDRGTLLGCPSVPYEECKATHTSGLSILNSDDDTKDKMSWKWTKGEASDLASFGSPMTTDSYFFCIWSYKAGGYQLKSDTIITDINAWSTKGSKLTFKDKEGLQHGVTSIKISAGDTPSIKLKAKGEGVMTPVPFDASTYLEPNSGVVTQLIAGNGNCWGFSFLDNQPSKNTPGKLSVKDGVQVCGDGMAEFEICDGSDDAACPDNCTGFCTCLP